MTEAVAGGSIENGGPPKAPSPCTIKVGLESGAERPIIGNSPPSVVAAVDLNNTDVDLQPNNLEEVVSNVPTVDSTVPPPLNTSPPTQNSVSNNTLDNPSSEHVTSSEEIKVEVEKSVQSNSENSIEETPQADAHPNTQQPSSASITTGADSDSTRGVKAPAPYVGAPDVPCMRGALTHDENGSYLIAGSWAMTASAHETEGHTSPFELHLPPPTTPSPSPSYSGIYSGYFMLMQGEGKPALKVDEKKVHLTFISNSTGGFNVQGSGRNRFGQFTMNGTVSNNNVELFRAYLAKGEKPKGDGRKKKPTLAPINSNLPNEVKTLPGPGSPGGGLGGKSIQQLSISIQKPVGEDEALSPGRTKRATAGDWKSKADTIANRDANSGPTRKGKGKEHATIPEAGQDETEGPPQKVGRVRKIPAHLKEIPDDKPVRLNEVLRKCLNLLRELGKNPSAHWFAQPVDWRFFGLLDYPKIIKEPMDFASIRSKVENGEITTADDFKKAMMLVFRNAMTYNAKRDNIVHIAAREILALFEEKFRTQIEPIALAAEKEPEIVPTENRGKGSGRGRKGGAGSGPGRGRKGPKSSQDDLKPKSVGQQPGGGGMVPKAHFNALQEQMEMMKQQLETLKRQTSQTDMTMQAQMHIGGSSGGGGGRKAKDTRPFTADEKEALKMGISDLPQAKIPRVLDIISEQVGNVGGNDGEVEIDLDTLDPPTLHLLQRYVKQCAPRKRKKPTPNQSQQPLQQLPSPGIQDYDLGVVDMNTLEEHAFGDMGMVDNKRGRASFDPMMSYDDPIVLPDTLEGDM